MKGMHALVIGAMLALLAPAVAAPAWADGDGYGASWRLVRIDHDRGDHGFRHEGRDNGDRGFRYEARDHGDHGFRHDDRGWHSGFFYDRRYHHDRYYPPRGYFARGLPGNYMILYYGGLPYYYGQGIWYRSSGLGFVVITPPYGIVAPVLPPYYTTVWVGGVPYYYANGVYYVWRPAAQGYVVMQPPADVTTQPPAGASAPLPSSNPDEFYVYPQKGQSATQQAKDRYECHRWAVGQTGFDPSQPAAGLPPADLTAKRADYRRAIEACLDARGYSVK